MLCAARNAYCGSDDAPDAAAVLETGAAVAAVVACMRTEHAEPIFIRRV